MSSAWKALGVSCLVLLAASGCGIKSLPVEYYTLNVPAQKGIVALPVAAADVALGVGPATFPEYLERPQIVTRMGANQITVNEFHRWAGSLERDFLRVLAQNLSMLLDTHKVVVYPADEWFDVHYRVVLDVQQFEGRPGQEVFLSVGWLVTEPRHRAVLSVQHSNITEPVSAPVYSALVAAHSEALSRLSAAIAKEIALLHARRDSNAAKYQ